MNSSTWVASMPPRAMRSRRANRSSPLLRSIVKGLPVPLKDALRRVRGVILDVHAIKSYAQEGEDLVLRRIFDQQPTGFYVDVGAHHPKRFSNTYIFYKAGWHGINIEPNPAVKSLFASTRPRDIHVQVGISDQTSTLTYYEFDEPALNSFDGELVRWRLANTPYKVVRESAVPVERLDAVLARLLPPGQAIDFLSVDVEGLDVAVLRSNDWTRFRPKCVVVEALQSSLESALRGEACVVLQEQGYELFAKTYNSLIFRLRESR
jgi:FkbM family methyltransferase